MSMQFPNPEHISAEEFELTVRKWFETFAESLDSFDVQHREIISGVDGDYEIDVAVRFTAFGGAKFLVLCECKKHRNPIKREVIQVLNDRKRSLGAHKAIVVSTVKYQSGAEEYAAQNGIALIQVVSGSVRYIQNSASSRLAPIPKDADPYAGFFTHRELPAIITTDMTLQFEEYLRARPQ